MEVTFGTLDWIIVAGVLVASTVVGGVLAGPQHSIKDFFLGGRKLPWPAVCASIVATEISAVTYISLPFIVFRPGGDITYLQLGLIGSFIARCVVGYVLVPAYYRKEIYSPYDFMGERLGHHMKQMTTFLFSLGGVLAQASRVYLTALVLEVMLHKDLQAVSAATGIDPLAIAMIAVGAIAIIWTIMGGIATVIWTDTLLFLLFIAGIVVTLITLDGVLAGGLPEALAAGADQGKFTFFNFDTSPTQAYTFWAALFAASWGGVGAYGTDQMMAQRLLCCRNEQAARRAVIVSTGGLLITFAVAVIGVGLWAYYEANPLQGEALAQVTEKGDRIFPIFIAQVMPDGVRGLVLAGALAAAISSLDSILAALSQTTLTSVIVPWRQRRGHAALEEAHAVRTSRWLVLGWGIILCGIGFAMTWISQHFDSILDLALAMASYTGGALLAGFILALKGPRHSASGFVWSAPLSVLAVFAVSWHQPMAQTACIGLLIATALLWMGIRLIPAWRANDLRRHFPATVGLVGLMALIACLSLFAYTTDGNRTLSLAWPWFVPVGSLFAWTGALLLSDSEKAPSPG